MVDHTKDHNQGRNNHKDPEWKHLTYGDIPFNNTHAQLRGLKHGDYIFFNCNLRKCRDQKLYSCCPKRHQVKGPTCKWKGEKRWYVIGFFKLREDPVSCEELLESGRIQKRPYSFNAHLQGKEYEEEPDRHYIFVGDMDSRRLKYPFPLPISARRYGITVHHKKKKRILEKLKDTYRCKRTNGKGAKGLLSDISGFQKNPHRHQLDLP